MSASNWAICPKCLAEAQAKLEAHLEQFGEWYETSKVVCVENLVDPESCRTFREDYEIYGADKGEVTVDYSGECSKCGLCVDFIRSHKFWP